MDKKKSIILSCSIIFIIGLTVFLWINLTKDKNCSDGTLINTCSNVKPYYCEKGKLVEKASVCNCQEDSIINGESCSSKYSTEPKEINLTYYLNGKEKEINFTLYKGAYDYLAGLSSSINETESPTLLDFRLKNLDNKIQMQFLYPLLIKIQEITPNKDDQMRIAISLVQNIEFGESNKTKRIGQDQIPYQRKAYEILYEGTGVCSEKSELLIFLLRGLGYNTAFIYYPLENHEAVGIKCSQEHSLNNTEYCFIETTGPSIITDDKTEYLGNSKLNSVPKIIQISQGKSLNDNVREIKDAITLMKIREKMKEKGQINFIEYFQFKKIKSRYGLPEFSNYKF